MGRAAGLEPSDIIHAITAATGLDGEAVRNVRVLEQFTLLEVPDEDADRVVDQVSGTEVCGQLVAPRAAPPADAVRFCQLRGRPPRLERARCVPNRDSSAGC